MTASFVHLHLHTEYSLVDGLIRIDDLVKRTAEARMLALAVTDRSALFSTVKFYRTAETKGIKPIIGADVWLASPAGEDKQSRLVLLCQNQTGYRNLTRLVTRSYLEGQRLGVPYVHPEWFEGMTDGLIALSGGRAGEVGQALLGGNVKEAKKRLKRWLELFPERFYLELQRTGRPDEEVYLEGALDLAAASGTPVVATNDVCFLNADDYEAHEARICIHEGRTLNDPRRPRRYSPQQYLRSAEEMVELFADIPEAIENTLHIARRCNLGLTLDKYFLPEFPAPEGVGLEDWLRQEAGQGLERRLAVLFDPNASDFPEKRKTYDERLATEIDVILRMGFAGYFLIVADFIHWAKENGIPVGPGRGSGAGSLAAYALGITDLDPLQYDLLFERFLNPERVSMPDFDVDFCMDRRDEVIAYVAQRFGRDRVSQIITHGSMAAKAVVRDVGRVLGHPYGFVDRIAKLIPFALDMTLERALAEEPALRERFEQEEEVRTLIELAQKLEGLCRNAGRHAGGVVIAPTPLTDFMPLYCEEGGENAPVSQFDMGDVEAMGLVKFDFLGLRTLTIIDWAVRDINRIRATEGQPPIAIERIPLDDKPTFDLIRRAGTTAVFQLESRGMKDLIKRLQPDIFEDLIALVALFRPGPLQSGMVDDFINRKHGRAKVQYPHPALEPVLKPTYGVILYQEQVMQIAQVLAGYSLGGADLLRRAMGKKKPEEMAKQRAVFVEGSTAGGVNGGIAASIFDLMEKFAGYGFNKSHSAAYALIAYQTAWLKAHYPAAFMAAVLSADMDNTDKVVSLIDECRQLGLRILPPEVNACAYKFTVADARSIRYGLGAIKGVGASAIEAILTEREAGGRFKDLFDLCRRVDLRKANRRVLEALIRAGALDGLGPGRSALVASLDKALLLAEQYGKNSAAGQEDLFGLGFSEVNDSIAAPAVAFESAPDWTDQERLAGEKDTLGLYLTGHPIDRYEADLNALVNCRLIDLKPGSLRVGGLVMGLRTNNSKRGRMAVALFDDRTARAEVVVYAETLLKYAEVLAKDQVLVVEGTCNVDEFSGGHALVAERIYDIEEARAAFARQLVISVEASRAADGFAAELQDILEPHRPGPCPVVVDYERPEAAARLRLGGGWRVRPSDDLLGRLKSAFGEERIKLEY